MLQELVLQELAAVEGRLMAQQNKAQERLKRLADRLNRLERNNGQPQAVDQVPRVIGWAGGWAGGSVGG